MESALNQRDMYKRLYEQDSSSVNAQMNPASPRTPVNKSKTEFSTMTPSGDMQSLKNELKMVYYFYISNSLYQNSHSISYPVIYCIYNILTAFI